MNLHSKAYDVAVIGGGLTGLMAANDLARAGLSVVVLEKGSRVGGRGLTVQKKGAMFNLGGHALYRGGEAYRMLEELGVKLPGGVPANQSSAIWNGKVVTLPADPVRLLASRLLTWAGKMELGGLMMKLGKLNTEAIAPVSLRDWAEREVRDPMVRHIFYALVRTGTYSHDPSLQLAAPALKQVQRALKSGVLYIDGGWQTIVDQLREGAIRAGADVLTDRHVTAIEHNRSAVSRISFADGSGLDVPRVIATSSPADTYRLVRDAERTALRRWKEQAQPVMAACLDLSLRRLPVAEHQLVIGIDQPVLFTNQSRAAKLSDNGDQVIHVIKYNGPGNNDPQTDERMLEQTMDLVQPGWRAEVAARQFLPNMTVVHDYMHMARTAPLPGPAVPEIAGLYVAGDWVSHGESLLDAAAASARRAALHIIDERLGAATGRIS